MMGKVKIRFEDLAAFVAGLVKEGVCFDSYILAEDKNYYIVELTGGC